MLLLTSSLNTERLKDLFTIRLSSKFLINSSPNIAPQLEHVATLPGDMFGTSMADLTARFLCHPVLYYFHFSLFLAGLHFPSYFKPGQATLKKSFGLEQCHPQAWEDIYEVGGRGVHLPIGAGE